MSSSYQDKCHEGSVTKVPNFYQSQGYKYKELQGQPKKSQMQIFSFSETPPFQRWQQKPLDTFSAKPAVAGGIKVIRSGIQGSTLYVLCIQGGTLYVP